MPPLARAQVWMLAAVALGVPLSAWGALYPGNTWLQVGPVTDSVSSGTRAWRLNALPDARWQMWQWQA